MPIPQSALIVDDEAHVRVYMRLLLSKMGVTNFREADTLDDAKAAFTENRPDVIVLDINMPEGSGLSFLQEVREQDEDVYIVIFTGDAQAYTVNRAIEMGADWFVRKDLPKDTIIQELSDLFSDEEE